MATLIWIFADYIIRLILGAIICYIVDMSFLKQLLHCFLFIYYQKITHKYELLCGSSTVGF